jgi:hypothetical protein
MMVMRKACPESGLSRTGARGSMSSRQEMVCRSCAPESQDKELCGRSKKKKNELWDSVSEINIPTVEDK